MSETVLTFIVPISVLFAFFGAWDTGFEDDEEDNDEGGWYENPRLDDRRRFNWCMIKVKAQDLLCVSNSNSQVLHIFVFF